jgi:hypothetical protein
MPNKDSMFLLVSESFVPKIEPKKSGRRTIENENKVYFSNIKMFTSRVTWLERRDGQQACARNHPCAEMRANDWLFQGS